MISENYESSRPRKRSVRDRVRLLEILNCLEKTEYHQIILAIIQVRFLSLTASNRQEKNYILSIISLDAVKSSYYTCRFSHGDDIVYSE